MAEKVEFKKRKKIDINDLLKSNLKNNEQSEQKQEKTKEKVLEKSSKQTTDINEKVVINQNFPDTVLLKEDKYEIPHRFLKTEKRLSIQINTIEYLKLDKITKSIPQSKIKFTSALFEDWLKKHKQNAYKDFKIFESHKQVPSNFKQKVNVASTLPISTHQQLQKIANEKAVPLSKLLTSIIYQFLQNN